MRPTTHRLIHQPLLLIALLTFVACDGEAVAQPFAGNINRWVAQDALDPPTQGSVLFAGSSSIRRWEQLAFDFADYKVIQRGFGGAQFENLNRYVDQIVRPYNPSAIVLWIGTNDIASGESPTEVLGDYKRFVDQVHNGGGGVAGQPDVDIFFLGIMPTPGRFAQQPQAQDLNNAIAALAASNPKLHYVDLPTAFNAFNPPRSGEFLDLFDDAIHLSRAGYDIWTSVIRPQVEAVVAPSKVFALNPNTPQPGSKILFDFGPNNTQDGDHTLGPDANGNHWNNWHPADGGVVVIAGEHIGNLVDATGVATGIGLTITAGFNTNGKVSGGLLDPDPALLGDLAIGSATQDFFTSTGDKKKFGGNDEVGGGFVIDGLNPDLAYDFKFLGSQQGSAESVTEYRLTGANGGVATLQTTGADIGSDGDYDGNDNQVAIVSGIRPDAFGQVFFDMTLLSGSAAYLNAMEITVTTAASESSSANVR
ncbi:MAG: GDSL-type esterase/lipase family protein [Planctomycetota bacterium]